MEIGLESFMEIDFAINGRISLGVDSFGKEREWLDSSSLTRYLATVWSFGLDNVDFANYLNSRGTYEGKISFYVSNQIMYKIFQNIETIEF